MTRADTHGRRLNLRAALAETLRLVPRMGVGAGGALVLTAVIALLPMILSLPGWAQAVRGFALALSSLVVLGALARIGVTPDLAAARRLGLGPIGLQLGLPEARLVGAFLLCLLFLSMILVVLALVVLAVFGTAELDVEAIRAREWAAVGPPWKLAMLAMVGLITTLVPLLLIVRLSLFPQATLGRGQMVSLNSMGIAYGSFWPLTAGLAITAAPSFALAAACAAGWLTPQVCCAAAVLVLVLVQAPLTFAFLGATYRQLEYWTPGEGAS